MLKIKNLILILFLLFHHTQASELIEVSLKEFAVYASKYSNKNIAFDDSIDQDKLNFYISSSLSKDTYFEVFKAMLLQKDLQITCKSTFCYVSKIKEKEEIKEESKVYYFSFNYLSENELKPIFELFNVPYTYIHKTNSIVFKGTLALKNDIFNLLSKLDISSKQLKLKITILETNIDELKDRGFEISAYSQTLKNNSDN